MLQVYNILLKMCNLSNILKTVNIILKNISISISPILSKIFEHCILSRYSKFLATNSNQFGFKKGSGCDHAIYSVRKVVEHFVAGGSTVNVCLLDLSKAFDKMDHSVLYLKLMDRSSPVQILSVLENWFSLRLSCVKWDQLRHIFTS